MLQDIKPGGDKPGERTNKEQQSIKVQKDSSPSVTGSTDAKIKSEQTNIK